MPIVWKVEIREATESNWFQYLDNLIGDLVYAVGGGLTTDAAKYVASKRCLQVVCNLTALSVDAFITWASGIRVKGVVQYIETKVPEDLIVDLKVIAAAPPSIRAAAFVTCYL